MSLTVSAVITSELQVKKLCWIEEALVYERQRYVFGYWPIEDVLSELLLSWSAKM